ncbi:MAG: 1-deoxy-D-xylulose-5-phosphate reductoisomerase [Bacteroidales bacterium]|nr:1-deoxy-D-xylulose-5-phosphate reductoisomerase [Bacteroidales bacterium]
MDGVQRLAVLGSTGSIGTQTLEVVRRHPDKFTVEVLTAGTQADLLVKQAMEFKPNAVVIGDAGYEKVRDALSSTDIKVFAGDEALNEVCAFDDVDTVVTAVMGSRGLKPTLTAVENHKKIALANKETLVMGGHLVYDAAKQYGAEIVPIDSEHSAIHQCLQGELPPFVERLILTGSGGPFRGRTRESMCVVRPEEALKHPTWRMGRKISIDSATLMNKGLEIIEASYLFDMRPEYIEVLIHPQSIVHSLVQFCDGSVKAQLGVPDMKGPILYALASPDRLYEPEELMPRLSLDMLSTLTFEEPDRKNFPCLAMAEEAAVVGGGIPCVLNAANEVAVEAFLNGELSFLDIPNVIWWQLDAAMGAGSDKRGGDLEDLLALDAEVRAATRRSIEKKA